MEYKKKIATFGCSFSEGVNTDETHKSENNWPLFLSKKVTDSKVYNCAIGATSIDYMLEKLLDYKHENPDSICVFQATKPHRFTREFYHEDFYKTWQTYEKFNTENYVKLDKENIIRFTAGTQFAPTDYRNDREYKRTYKFIKGYYDNYNDEHQMLQFNSYVLMASHVADFCYIHTRNPNVNYQQKINDDYYSKYFTSIPCVHEILGNEDFLKFSQDEGSHFNMEGNMWIADWVYDNIKDRL